MFFQLEMHGGIFQSCWSLTVSLRGGECITGAGGEGGPRGTRLCLNLGGSIGSTGASTIRITRLVAPDAWLAPCPRRVSNVGRVLLVSDGLVERAAARLLGGERLEGEARPLRVLRRGLLRRLLQVRLAQPLGLDGIHPEWTIFPSRWPTVASTSWRTLPLASVVSARVCAAFFPLRPMSSGYCATWISGKAPPPPKSACDRGTQPLRWPCGGGRLGPAAAAAGRDGGGPIDDEDPASPSAEGPDGWTGAGSVSPTGIARGKERGMRGGGEKKIFTDKRGGRVGRVCVLKVLRHRGQLF